MYTSNPQFKNFDKEFLMNLILNSFLAMNIKSNTDYLPLKNIYSDSFYSQYNSKEIDLNTLKLIFNNLNVTTENGTFFSDSDFNIFKSSILYLIKTINNIIKSEILRKKFLDKNIYNLDLSSFDNYKSGEVNEYTQSTDIFYLTDKSFIYDKNLLTLTISGRKITEFNNGEVGFFTENNNTNYNLEQGIHLWEAYDVTFTAKPGIDNATTKIKLNPEYIFDRFGNNLNSNPLTENISFSGDFYNNPNDISGLHLPTGTDLSKYEIEISIDTMGPTINNFSVIRNF